MEKYIGKFFEFAEVFTCDIAENGVWIEQYSEGSYCLEHIKTEKQLIQLYEILTGEPFYESNLKLNYYNY